MKILQVIPYFVPAFSYGGPVKVCFDVSKKLAERGHAITVVTTDTLDGKNRIKNLEEEIEGIKVKRFKNISNWLAKNCNGYLPIGFFFWIKKNIRKFDAVHCHDFFTYQNIIVAYFCKKNNIPFVVQPHGTLSPVRQEARFRIIKKIFLKLFKKVLKNSKNIIALTENEKREIASIDENLRSKIEIIPNGLDMKDFENINKINLHEKYVIPKENKIIGYIGRIQYIKGIDISLEILAGLKDKIKFTYLIIGPDEGEKEKLEKMIKELGLKDNVIFAGILTGKEKLETIKSCDLFLFTSRNEGLPMTVLEVAALGIPQIISKECNVPEVEKYKAGFEINLTNRDAFSNKILAILQDKDVYAMFSENSEKMIADKFTIGKVCNELNLIIN